MTADDAVMVGIALLGTLLDHVEESSRDEVRKRIADLIDAQLLELRSSAQEMLDKRRREIG